VVLGMGTCSAFLLGEVSWLPEGGLACIAGMGRVAMYFEEEDVGKGRKGAARDFTQFLRLEENALRKIHLVQYIPHSQFRDLSTDKTAFTIPAF